eukprot:1158400-Pelagomonas_calceolata.AAC.10
MENEEETGGKSPIEAHNQKHLSTNVAWVMRGKCAACTSSFTGANSSNKPVTCHTVHTTTTVVFCVSCVSSVFQQLGLPHLHIL